MSQVYVNSFASIPFAPRGWMLAWAPIHLSFQKLLHTCSLCVNAPAAWKQFADNCHSTTTQETQASRSSSCPPGQGLRQALAHHSQALVAGRRNSMHWSSLKKFKGIYILERNSVEDSRETLVPSCTLKSILWSNNGCTEIRHLAPVLSKCIKI